MPKLYAILLIACTAGYIWLFYGMKKLRTEEKTVGVCLFKYATNIPCPSCGSTRSALALLNGNFSKALYFNPFGIIIASIMLVAPGWVLYDLATKKKTLLRVYEQTETLLKNPKIAIPLVLLVVINWIWNIKKYL